MEVHRSKRLKKKLKHPTTTTTDDSGIPDWLLFELLLRLPPNSVFICRLVSKRWLSIASDPYLIRAYASRASSISQPYWTVLSPNVQSDWSPKNCVMPRETYLRPRLCKICLPHQPRDDAGRSTAVGVSDGLVLYYRSQISWLSDFDLSNFYLCNPITGHWIRACTYTGPLLSCLRSGWGFLSRLDGEFVLKSFRIVKAGDDMDILDAVIFEVYYSETDEWKKFTVTLPNGLRLNRRRLKMQESGAVLRGILHWAEFEIGVIVYDPEANPNRMRVIPRPRSADHDGLLQLCQCLEYRGELRYFEGYLGRNHDFPSFCIWRRLEEEDCGSSNGEWCVQHKIQSKDIFGDPMRSPLMMESLFFDPCDSDVVYVVGSGCLTLRFVFSYNLKSGRLEQRPEMIVGNGPFSLQGGDLLPFTLSLVVPPWPTRVAKKFLERR